MRDFLNSALTWIHESGWESPVRALVVFLVGVALARLLASFLSRLLGQHLDRQGKMLLRRAVTYPGVVISLAAALVELGFDLSIFLGAAGIVTVAVGFASQTSASNLISGLFLLAERSFVVGDVIRVGQTTGEVLSIDLLSAKVRTFDNLFVRLPNETLVKSEVTNLSRFPIRRIDLLLRVGYSADLDAVRELLLAIADEEPRALVEPKPIFFAQDFEASGVLLQFSVWAQTGAYLEVRSALQAAIRRRFDDNQVALPTARWTLDAASHREALPIPEAKTE